MAKIRVYELARELNMTNKMLLEKISHMEIDVKSHMSSLEDEDIKIIKENLLGAKKQQPTDSDSVEVKRIKPTVIRRRKKVVPPPPPPPEPETPAEEVPVPEPEEEEVETKEKDSVKVVEKKKAVEKETPEKEAAVTPELHDEDKDIDVKGEPVSGEIPAPVKKKKKEIEKKRVGKKVPAEPKPDKIIHSEEIVEVDKAEKGKKKSAKKKVKKVKKHVAAKIIKLPEVPIEKPVELDESKKTVTPVKGENGQEKPSEKPADQDKKKNKKKKRPVAVEVEPEKDKKFFKKKISFRKKAVVEGKALYDTDYGRGRKGKKGSKKKQAIGQKTQITTPKAIKRRVKVDDTIVLAELAKRMGIKANEMIQKLMTLGVMVTVNQTIDYDTAALVASEFDYEVERASFEEETILKIDQEDETGTLVGRPPVVTIMGHVDHGKTSLLDVIRKSSITSGEAGGITQHIGAYNVKTDKGQIVFLDTPGHEAFTAMRSRGAQVTDIVILVVAADDGVMPQTIEAINHSRAAEVPIIVAVNKIDKEEADPERVKRELSEHGIVSEEWGGESIFVNVSAKQKEGIDDLLDMILLQAEVLELKANPDKLAQGHVIEAKLDSGRGPVATVLVQEGTLSAGEPLVCGVHHGKIRAMHNDLGKQINEAGPSIPVEVIGLSGVPMAGDEFIALDDEKNAKQVSGYRMQKLRASELAKSSRVSLEGLFEKMAEGEMKDLNLLIKADVHGSIEALKDSLNKLPSDEVKINVVHSATGTVSESDVSLAAVSNAIIIGFNVRPSAKVHEIAEEENVDMRFYDIIYDAIKDLKGAMVGLMDSTYKEEIIGRANVRETFVIPKKGTIAGSYVTDGKIERGQNVRLLRDGVIMYDGKISSLRRFKDDAKEVLSSYECGIGIENFNDIKVGDVIECYYMEEIKPMLE